MAAKGYTGIGRLEAYLGRPLSDAERAQVPYVLEVAERCIDAYVGDGWLTGAITAERYEIGGPIPMGTGLVIWLRAAPIASVTSVVAADRLGANTVTLAAGIDYSVVLSDGRLILASSWCGSGYDHVLVSYTPATTVVPEDAALAATMLVAELLGPTSGGGRDPGIKSFTLDGQTVVYRDTPESAEPYGLSGKVAELLAPYRRVAEILA